MPAIEQAQRLWTAGLKAAGPGVANLNAVEPNCNHSSADMQFVGSAKGGGKYHCLMSIENRGMSITV